VDQRFIIDELSTATVIN